MGPGSRSLCSSWPVRRLKRPPCHLYTPDLISSVRRSAVPRIWRVHFPAVSCKDGCRTSVPPPIAPEIKRFTMVNRMKFYIDGQWVDPDEGPRHPGRSTRRPKRRSRSFRSAGGRRRQGRGRRAARVRDLFGDQRRRASRAAAAIIEVYQSKYEEMAETISQEMGAPMWLARAAQAAAGLGHFFEMHRRAQQLQVRGAARARR